MDNRGYKSGFDRSHNNYIMSYYSHTITKLRKKMNLLVDRDWPIGVKLL